MEFWIAGISKAGRSSGDHLAHRTRVETRPAESVDIALLERHRKEGIPAETIGNSQLGCRFPGVLGVSPEEVLDRKSTRLNSSHGSISYAVCCLKKKTQESKRVEL